jgi:putative ABC transport system substrate-binding protein
MSRRVAVVAGFLIGLFVTVTASAQPATGTARVGLLVPSAAPAIVEVFRKALADLGYVEGRNLVLESRAADPDNVDRLAEATRALLEQRTDVLVAVGATAARAARSVTKDVPIVFVIAIDPVVFGLVASAQRPDGNVTGTTTFDPQQAQRQLETLRQALPGLTRIALLGDSGAAPTLYQSNEKAAQALGLQTVTVKVERGKPDFEAALDTVEKDGAGALVVLSTPVTTPNRKRIAELAIRHRLPTLAPRDHADAGMLLSYGTSFNEATRRAASLTDRLLKGAKPADVPVETVARHELIVNQKTAREIGVALPAAVVGAAAQVIQ